MVVDVVADGHNELFKVFEDAAPDALVGQIAEEALDLVQPRSRGGREVDVEPLMPCQPALDALVFVSGIVVADDMNLLWLRDGVLNHTQEA